MARSSKTNRCLAVELMCAAALLTVAMEEVILVEGAMSCSTVVKNLVPCMAYLGGKSAAPSEACCDGVKNLYTMTKSSRPDRIATCGCIRSQSKAMGAKLESSNVEALPGKCKVALGYSSSLNTNCNTIA